MKKTTILLFTLLVLEQIQGQNDQEITFKDYHLEYAIRSYMDWPTGPITQQDMSELTRLVAANRSIENLDGLQYALKAFILTIIK